MEKMNKIVVNVKRLHSVIICMRKETIRAIVDIIVAENKN